LLRETTPGGTVFSDFDPLAGRGRELYRAEAGKLIDVWSLSPDGSRIAGKSFFDKEVKIVSLVDGRTTNLKLPAFAQRIAWSATGDALFLSERSGDETAIVRVDLKGSIRVLKRWNLQDCSWVGIGSPSPDGRRLAFMEISQERNAWMLEGF
jgi:Tol biopolymer transport system component